MSVELVCSVCGKPYNGGTDRNVCPSCGASIEPREDISPERKDLKELLLRGGNGEKGVWKYRAFFPGFEDIEPVTMEEGNTPLIHAKALGAAYGMGGLYLKNETANPSATYKDRFAALAISQYKHENASAVALGSAGNAGSAVAAYAAKAGIPCYVILPAGGVFARAQQAMAYGARFIRADGEVNDCIELIEKGVSRFGWKNACTTMLHNPLASEGYKTMVYEMFLQLGERLPDVIVCPIGGGILISKMYRACRELIALGLAEKMPRLVGVQAAGCPPVVWAIENGKRETPVWQNPATIAGSINDPVTFEGVTALHVIRASNGEAVAVTDDEIKEAMKLCARKEAVLAEPASAATLAAVLKLKDAGKIRAEETVVTIITGSALRDLPLFSDPGNEVPFVHPGNDAEMLAAMAHYQQ
jgi:threonine synthase